jgi:hypothetical protein
MISEKEAIKKAEEWLSLNRVDFQGRKMTVSLREGTYEVVYYVPEDTLGGDFTLMINSQTGDVIDARIER